MSKDNHKIDAADQNVFEVLNEKKYTVDYFQREYSWEQKHISQLITDLTSTFLDVYTEGDDRARVEHYNNYYLGPFVVSRKDGEKSIIDGQQRLTSITLFLIFLNNLQKELGGKESIEPLVFSEKYGKKSFNIQVEERMKCLEKLFLEGSYEVQPDDEAVDTAVEDGFQSFVVGGVVVHQSGEGPAQGHGRSFRSWKMRRLSRASWSRRWACFKAWLE